MKGEKYPTFICIGAMKCGTTSLHEYLDEHPDICMSRPKETNFFLENKGVESYQECFPEEADAYGESSQNYSKHPGYSGVPERVHNLLPDVKLLYLVRDPIERAISHYFHNWTVWNETESIDQALQPVSESGYINTSRYYYQLSQFLEYYSMDDILVVQSEQLRTQRIDVLNEVFHLIGVDQIFDIKAFKEEYNKSSNRARQSPLGALLTKSRFGRVLKEIGKTLTSRETVERVRDALKQEVERPEPSEVVLRKAREYLREDANKLRRLTGKEFSSWSV